MKKLFSSILVLGLMLSGYANADILLKDCGMFIPAGKMFNQQTRNEDKLIKLEDSRHEYFISFKDSSVYYTSVSPSSFTDALNSTTATSVSRTQNSKFIITFADEKLITAKGKSIIDPSYPDLYTTIELDINLENGEVRTRHGAETLKGMKMLQMHKKMGTANNIYKCEFNKSKNIKKESSKSDIIKEFEWIKIATIEGDEYYIDHNTVIKKDDIYYGAVSVNYNENKPFVTKNGNALSAWYSYKIKCNPHQWKISTATHYEKRMKGKELNGFGKTIDSYWNKGDQLKNIENKNTIIFLIVDTFCKKIKN